MFPFDQLSRLDSLEALDPLVSPLSKAVTGVVRPQPVADALHGTWLGHPLHAALVQVPIGSFVSANLLDAAGGDGRSARMLAGVGLVSAVPAALAGATDWSRSNPSTQRTGLVHALLNAAGLALWGASWSARRRGRSGSLLGLLGTSVLGASATIGGHLSYRDGLGADTQATIADTGPADWTDVGPDDLPLGKPVLRQAGGTPVLLVRSATGTDALVDLCAHQSGPLHEGTLADGCVTCPWHGSVFRLSDGAVQHGPSVHPQPALDVRAEDGRLQVRLRG
ncbi:MAG: Rieske 2Fe-2S domain-containing protein [Mycobacteriales bacterium]